MMKLIKKIRDYLIVNVKFKRYKIGKNFHAGRGVIVWAKSQLIIGDNFYIGKYSIIECDAVIGDNVIIANHVSMIGKYDHNYQQIGVPTRLASKIRDNDYSWKGLSQKIVIEDDVWVGLGAIILSGVTIGRGSIIAAGSVLTKNVEPYSIYGGNPAKKIRDRFDSREQLTEHIQIYESKYMKK